MSGFGRLLGVLVALALIFTGTVLLLGNLGFLATDPVDLIVDFWPVLLIVGGLYIIWLRVRPTPRPEGMTISEELGGASKAVVNVDFGAGELRISPLAGGDNLFEGAFLFEAEKTVRRTGELVEVRLRRSRWGFPPFFESPRDEWRVGLTTRIPLALRVNTGASRVLADLTDNTVELVELNTGASDVTLTLPRKSGFTRAVIKAGAADIKVNVPEGVAAKIRSTGALSSLRVNEKRFPKTDGRFESPDFESAENKVDLEVSTGVASVTVS